MSESPIKKRKAIIIGAGPAGLTTAYEMVNRTDIQPIIFEMTSDIGGISKTVKYKGNRIDIGGHRFFSKSDRVMDWWMKIMPLQAAENEKHLNISYQGKKRGVDLSTTGPDPEKTDDVMLIRNRLSRIFYLRKFFNYPISLSGETIKNLGLVRIMKIGISYIRANLFPIKKEKSLEDFFINRFGKELYLTFFKDYTEKVWGVPCNEIKPEWGAQRIKGLSITKAIAHALKKSVSKKDNTDVAQKDVETSLIEHFMYPKLGPGQMWETVADMVKAKGAEIHMEHQLHSFEFNGDNVSAVKIKNLQTGEISRHEADFFFSTMPVKDLINSFEREVPDNIKEISNGLVYRDFMTVGLLLNKLKIKNETNIPTKNNVVPDNWIYIQEADVKVGRLQIFNNWSPYLVQDPDKVWIGMEYFVYEGDELWNMKDEDMKQFGIDELAKIDIINKEDVLDSVVIRMPKTYPAYFGSYDDFPKVIDYVSKIENLFLIGRNGMHRYNNQDHSMLTAMTSVDNIIAGIKDKSNIWDVNTEEEYHESK
jgi:protoporphyrinogen oxidase